MSHRMVRMAEEHAVHEDDRRVRPRRRVPGRPAVRGQHKSAARDRAVLCNRHADLGVPGGLLRAAAVEALARPVVHRSGQLVAREGRDGDVDPVVVARVAVPLVGLLGEPERWLVFARRDPGVIAPVVVRVGFVAVDDARVQLGRTRERRGPVGVAQRRPTVVIRGDLRLTQACIRTRQLKGLTASPSHRGRRGRHQNARRERDQQEVQRVGGDQARPDGPYGPHHVPHLRLKRSQQR